MNNVNSDREMTIRLRAALQSVGEQRDAYANQAAKLHGEVAVCKERIRELEVQVRNLTPNEKPEAKAKAA